MALLLMALTLPLFSQSVQDASDLEGELPPLATPTDITTKSGFEAADIETGDGNIEVERMGNHEVEKRNAVIHLLQKTIQQKDISIGSMIARYTAIIRARDEEIARLRALVEALPPPSPPPDPPVPLRESVPPPIYEPPRPLSARGRIECAKGRYKTNLCREWMRNIGCRHGDRCVFAHGEVELRPRSEIFSERSLSLHAERV